MLREACTRVVVSLATTWTCTMLGSDWVLLIDRPIRDQTTSLLRSSHFSAFSLLPCRNPLYTYSHSLTPDPNGAIRHKHLGFDSFRISCLLV